MFFTLFDFVSSFRFSIINIFETTEQKYQIFVSEKRNVLLNIQSLLSLLALCFFFLITVHCSLFLIVNNFYTKIKVMLRIMKFGKFFVHRVFHEKKLILIVINRNIYTFYQGVFIKMSNSRGFQKKQHKCSFFAVYFCLIIV